MDQNKIITSEDIIKHHGVIGQKWGIRRYQNKDGSLTPAGKKRAKKLLDQYEKLTGKKIHKVKKDNNTEKKEETNPDRDLILRIKNKNGSKTVFTKSINDMSNDELIKVTNRLNAESNFITAVNKRDSFSKKEVDKGKSFASRIKDDIVIPAVTNASRTQAERWLNKTLGNVLGLNGTKKTSKKDVLKAEVEELELEKRRLAALEQLEHLRSKKK